MFYTIWTIQPNVFMSMGFGSNLIDLITNKAVTIMNALTSCLILINYNMFPDTDMSVRRTSRVLG